MTERDHIVNEVQRAAEKASNLRIVDAPEVIGMDEHPTEAVKGKPESSINVGLRMVKNGDVMRSDRLKQVMQDIDPTFDEKNLGKSKFSKFAPPGLKPARPLSEPKRSYCLRFSGSESTS